jgi:5-methylcytosine-specific restriction protein A
MIRIVVIQNEKELSYSIEVEFEEPNLDILMGTGFYELFKRQELFRKVGSKNIIKYNQIFDIMLMYDNDVIFDTTNEKYDEVRQFFKYNSTPESKRNFLKYLHNSVLQNTCKLFDEKDFLNFIKEGKVRNINKNVYERNPKARRECLLHHGYSCKVCGFSFERVYGEIGKNFIHVHHTTPLSSLKNEYKINPIRDLVPVCPNCHAMIHKTTPPIEINHLKEIMMMNE